MISVKPLCLTRHLFSSALSCSNLLTIWLSVYRCKVLPDVKALVLVGCCLATQALLPWPQERMEKANRHACFFDSAAKILRQERASTLR